EAEWVDRCLNPHDLWLTLPSARTQLRSGPTRGGDPLDAEIEKLTRPSDQTFSSRNLPRRPASTATEISLTDGIDCPSIGHVDCRQRAAVYATDRPQPI